MFTGLHTSPSNNNRRSKHQPHHHQDLHQQYKPPSTSPPVSLTPSPLSSAASTPSTVSPSPAHWQQQKVQMSSSALHQQQYNQYAGLQHTHGSSGHQHQHQHQGHQHHHQNQHQSHHQSHHHHHQQMSSSSHLHQHLSSTTVPTSSTPHNTAAPPSPLHHLSRSQHYTFSPTSPSGPPPTTSSSPSISSGLLRGRRGRQARPSSLSSSMHKAVRRFANSVGAPHVVPPAGFRDFRGWLIRLNAREVRPIWDQLIAAIVRDARGDAHMIMGMKEDVVREIVKCVVVPRPDESAKLVSTNAGRQASRPRSGTTLMTLLDQQMSRVIGNGSSTNGGGSASSSRGVSQYGMADVYPTATTTTMAMNGTAGHVGGRGGGSGRLTLAATGAGAGSGRLTSPAPVNGTRDMQSAGTSISGLPTSSGLLPHNVNSPIVNSISSPHLAGPTTTAAFAQHSGRTWSGQRQRSSIAYGRQQMTANCSGGLTGTHEVVVGDKRGRERDRDRDREKVLPSFRELDASLRRRK